MANQCSFCGVRRIETNTLVLNGGEFWCEFCEPCGETNVLHNAENAETLLVRELWDRCKLPEGTPHVRRAADIAKAVEIAAAEPQASQVDPEAQDAFDDWDNYVAECKAHDELRAAMKAERQQLRADHWDNLVYRCLHSLKHQAPQFLFSA